MAEDKEFRGCRAYDAERNNVQVDSEMTESGDSVEHRGPGDRWMFVRIYIAFIKISKYNFSVP